VRLCIRPLLLPALFSAWLFACGDSGDGGAVGLVRGRVRTQDGSSLEPVTVRVGDKSTKTDRDGYFTLEAKAGTKQRVSVESKEFAGGEAQVQVAKRGEANLELGVMRASALEVDEVEKGGRFEGEDGFTLKLPENALRAANGSATKGKAQVRYASVRDAKLMRVAPELRSGAGQNQEQRLKSHGLIEVRFFDDGDSALKLDGEAEIAVPLPAGSTLAEGEKVGLYHYDTSKGSFEREGEAEVKDGKWVAKVDKFSWWTIAEPAEATSCINARLLTPSERPAAGVVATAVGLDELWLSSASSDANGELCLEVPAGGNVALSAFWDDGERSGQWSRSTQAAGEAATCGGDCLELGAQPFSEEEPRRDAGTVDGGIRRDGGEPAMFEGLMETQTASTPGETLSFSFSALGGERLAYTVMSTASVAADIVIVDPNGQRISVGSRTVSASTSVFDDLFVLPELGGEYTLEITPRSGTGTFTLNLFGVPEDATEQIVAGADPVTVTVESIAQNAGLTFQAEGGERLAYTIDSTGDTAADVSLIGPAGNRLSIGNTTVSSGTHAFRDLFQLPDVAGEYRLEINPRDQGTGSFVIELSSVPDDVVSDVAIGGMATLSVPSLAQNGAFRIRGAAGGERLAYILDNQGAFTTDTEVLDPSGARVNGGSGANSAGTSRFADTFVLPSTPGDYLITVDPRGEAVASDFTLRLLSVPADTSAAITIGGSASLSVPSIGQNGAFTFSANGGERIAYSLQNSADGVADIQIVDPNDQIVSGTGLAISGGATSFHDAITLPAVAGTYQLQVDPRTQSTGGFSATLYAVPADAAATTTLQPYANAAQLTVTTTAVAQNAAIDITVGTANAVVAYYVTNNTTTVLDAELRSPGGALVTGSGRAISASSTGFVDIFTLGPAGSYRLLLDPRNQGTGTMGARIFQVSPDRPSAAVTPNGGATRVDLTIPGQVAAFTFSLNAGQTFNYTVARTGSSVADTRVLSPSQQVVSQSARVVSSATPLSVTGLTAAAAGTYTLEVDPRDDSIDAYNVTVTAP
jgi:hypothetical protein